MPEVQRLNLLSSFVTTLHSEPDGGPKQLSHEVLSSVIACQKWLRPNDIDPGFSMAPQWLRHVDFSKQYVIAVAAGQVQFGTTVEVSSVDPIEIGIMAGKTFIDYTLTHPSKPRITIVASPWTMAVVEKFPPDVIWRQRDVDSDQRLWLNTPQPTADATK